jgi:hypothetical protein
MPSDTIEFKVQQDYDLSKDGEKIIMIKLNYGNDGTKKILVFNKKR